MGRPLNRKYFDSGLNQVEGAAVSSLSFSNIGAGYFSANVAITLSAPQLPDSTRATVTNISLFGNGAIKTYTLNSGSGYVSAPTVTITGANTSTAVATSTLSNALRNTILITAYLPLSSGGTSAKSSVITAQKKSRAYLVYNSDGHGICSLVAGVPAAGQANILAYDALGSSYYVTSLSAHKAMLTQKTNGGSGFAFSTGTKAPWQLSNSAPPAGKVSIQKQ